MVTTNYNLCAKQRSILQKLLPLKGIFSTFVFLIYSVLLNVEAVHLWYCKHDIRYIIRYYKHDVLRSITDVADTQSTSSLILQQTWYPCGITDTLYTMSTVSWYYKDEVRSMTDTADMMSTVSWYYKDKVSGITDTSYTMSTVSWYYKDEVRSITAILYSGHDVHGILILQRRIQQYHWFCGHDVHGIMILQRRIPQYHSHTADMMSTVSWYCKDEVRSITDILRTWCTKF
jgi:hypothetical protein